MRALLLSCTAMAVAATALAQTALAQIPPSAGQLVPAFNGGRPLVVDASPDADAGTWAHPLPGGRVLVIGYAGRGVQQASTLHVVEGVLAGVPAIVPIPASSLIGAASDLENPRFLRGAVLDDDAADPRLLLVMNAVSRATGRGVIGLVPVAVRAAPAPIVGPPVVLHPESRFPTTDYRATDIAVVRMPLGAAAAHRPDTYVAAAGTTAGSRTASDIHLARIGFGPAGGPLGPDLAASVFDDPLWPVLLAQFHTLEITRVTPVAGSAELSAPSALAPRNLLFGGQCRRGAGDSLAVCIGRIGDFGDSPGLGGRLRVDRRFGTDGLVEISLSNGAPVRFRSLDVRADGSIVVGVGLGAPDGTATPALIFLTPAGTRDSTFAANGQLALPMFGLTGVIHGVQVSPHDVLQVTGELSGSDHARPFVFFRDLARGNSRYVELDLAAADGGSGNAGFFAHARMPDGSLVAVGTRYARYPDLSTQQTMVARVFGSDVREEAVEYHHPGFDHYFMTSSADEKVKLDAGQFAGWTRTGASFWVAPPDSLQTLAQAANVCRFFSAAFAPKSSHFYTAFAPECDTVRSNPDWTFEGEVFSVWLPDASGSCFAGTRMLRRFYNNGAGGAPNHRFVIDNSIAQTMTARGWIAEGIGPGVVGCAPN